jgi:hypothetical protein
VNVRLAEEVAVKLKAVVRFREFPFGTREDPPMQESIDCFDRTNRANPLIDGKIVGGTTVMTDGEWFWYAGLIHFIEEYNVRVSPESVEHAARRNWVVDRDRIPQRAYDFSYA